MSRDFRPPVFALLALFASGCNANYVIAGTTRAHEQTVAPARVIVRAEYLGAVVAETAASPSGDYRLEWSAYHYRENLLRVTYTSPGGCVVSFSSLPGQLREHLDVSIAEGCPPR